MVSAVRTIAQLTALLWANFDRTWRRPGRRYHMAEVVAIKDASASRRIELVEYKRPNTLSGGLFEGIYPTTRTTRGFTS